MAAVVPISEILYVAMHHHAMQFRGCNQPSDQWSDHRGGPRASCRWSPAKRPQPAAWPAPEHQTARMTATWGIPGPIFLALFGAALTLLVVLAAVGQHRLRHGPV